MNTHAALAPEALAQLFTDARTFNGWLPIEAPDALLAQAVDYARWGPTSANCSPLRIVFRSIGRGEGAPRAGAPAIQSRDDDGRACDGYNGL